MDEAKRDDLPPIEEEDEEAAEVMYLRPATPPPDAMSITEEGQLVDHREGTEPPSATIADILGNLTNIDEAIQAAEQDATFLVPQEAEFLAVTIPDPIIQEGATPAFEDTPPHPYPVAIAPEVTFMEPVSDTEDTPPNPVPVISTPSRPMPAQPVPEPSPLPPLATQPRVQVPPPPVIPPAPYTPPPLPPAPVTAAPPQAAPMSSYWLQQRVQAYLYGGYKLHRQQPMEAVLSYGKPLPLFWWVVGMSSIIGVLWYLFILLMSGFRRDTVYILIEPDGYPYEEGPGAAHIRRRRSNVGRRWGVVSILLVLFSVFTFFLVVLAGATIASQYQPELVNAYPEMSIFTGNVEANANEANVDNVRVIVLALVLLLGLSVAGFLGGAAMFVISYLHAAAFRVDVAPLPGMR